MSMHVFLIWSNGLEGFVGVADVVSGFMRFGMAQF